MTRPRHIFYGWWLVGITVFSMTLVITPIFQGLGLFFKALEREFGWSRFVLSLPFSLARAEGALLGPIEGYLVDRTGSRWMIRIGFAILGAGFIGFAFVQNIPAFFITFLVIFTGAGLGGFLPLIAAINHWFVRHRTKAMALGLLGINLGALLIPALAFFMTAFGWRTTSFGLGIFVWVVAIPIAALVRNRPEEYGQRPDGDPPHAPVGVDSDQELEDEGDVSFTVGEALRTRAFWAVTFAHSASAVAVVTMAVHLIPAMTDIGMTDVMAATVVTTYGLVGVVFQLIGGFLGDRLPKAPLIALFVTIQATGMLVVATVHTVLGGYIFAVLYGAGLGGRVPLFMAIRGDYFGRKRFATIMGISAVPMNLIMMGAPIAAGYLFDTLGSYTVPFLSLAALNYTGAVLILLAKKPFLPARYLSTTPEPSALAD